ncbi:CE112 protein, partial [Pitta sordida]|nr:CE112 protein [Pitta sordida]
MKSEEEISEKLDIEFKDCVVAMKYYFPNLRDDYDQKVCRLWIKKLCRSSETGIEEKEIRNSYAKLLLHMLKRGVLDCPFTQKPEQGRLKSLPPYMLTLADEPSSPRTPRSSDRLPEWVLRELETSEAPEESSSPALTLGAGSEQPAAMSHSLGCPRRPEEDDQGTSLSVRCFSFIDLEARLSSWNLGLENPRYLRKKPMPISLMTPKISPGKGSPCRERQGRFRTCDKQVEMSLRIAEGKFYEEKLKLQQKHDADIQKILDRKNDEIEMLKSTYERKQKESEEVIRKLEKRVQTLVRESQVVREAKEQQIVELKKMCEKSNDTLKNEWEKKV